MELKFDATALVTIGRNFYRRVIFSSMLETSNFTQSIWPLLFQF